ncbi:MAG TPA: hypothetical protein VFB59_01445, partial [Candidatus Saccharimonadales bacterium]|nr:hypothetical protein [Candidatus Saccharimonadales bacterium]
MAEQLAALSTQYKKSGQQLAFGNDDPFQRALLLSACIDESDVKLFAEHVVDAYSNIDAAAKAVSKGALTGYDKKTIAGKQAVEVLSAKEAFDPAYRITADLLEHSEFSGMQAVETMLSCGNAGPNGELLNKIDEDYFYRIPQPGEPSYAHLANVENYLTGIAGYGIDISQTGTSYSRLWSQMIRQTDRRQPLASRLAVAYAAKGNTALSDLFATEVRQHTQRGKMLVRLAELTSDPDERRERAHQIKIASYEALDCQGNCSDNYCDPDRDSQELILAAARLFITSGEPSRGKAFLRNLENSLRFPTGRFNAYAALYDRLADENYRQKAVNLLPYILRGDIAAGVTLVAKAD